MKKLLVLVLLLFATAAQSETYTWTDKDGTIHFSDSAESAPAQARKSRRHQTRESNAVPTRDRATSRDDIMPEVEGLKERMMKDQGIMALVRTLQNDPDMQKALGDPAIMKAVQAGDIDSLMQNPAFMKLLDNPRVKEIQKRLK